MTNLQQSPAPPAARPLAVLGAVAALLVGAALVLGSRDAEPSTGVRVSSVSGDADRAGTTGFDDAERPHAGLDPEHTDARRAAIATAEVGPAERQDRPPPGAFGTTSPCALRNRLLPRDLQPVVFKASPSPCRVARGTLDDPYLGRTSPYRDDDRHAVAVDHIVSFAYAWQHGAAGWTPAQRRAFGRDARNQVVVDARTVLAKAGRGPAAWLPPNVALRCAYAARFAEVATAHGLTVDPGDLEVAQRQCAPA